jgi:hypothetical protein
MLSNKPLYPNIERAGELIGEDTASDLLHQMTHLDEVCDNSEEENIRAMRFLRDHPEGGVELIISIMKEFAAHFNVEEYLDSDAELRDWIENI